MSKLFLILFISSIFSSSSLTIRRFQCVASNKTVASNYTCYAKSYSRTFSTVNFNFFFMRPLNEFKVTLNIFKKLLSINSSILWTLQYHVDMQHRSITPYFNSVINTTFNVCQFLNGSDKNLMAKFVLSIVLKSLPAGFIHECPYVGTFAATNVSLEKVSELSSFLGGRYRVINRFFDRKDANIFTGTFEFDL